MLWLTTNTKADIINLNKEINSMFIAFEDSCIMLEFDKNIKSAPYVNGATN